MTSTFNICYCPFEELWPMFSTQGRILGCGSSRSYLVIPLCAPPLPCISPRPNWKCMFAWSALDHWIEVCFYHQEIVQIRDLLTLGWRSPSIVMFCLHSAKLKLEPLSLRAWWYNSRRVLSRFWIETQGSLASCWLGAIRLASVTRKSISYLNQVLIVISDEHNTENYFRRGSSWYSWFDPNA